MSKHKIKCCMCFKYSKLITRNLSKRNQEIFQPLSEKIAQLRIFFEGTLVIIILFQKKPVSLLVFVATQLCWLERQSSR